VKRPQAPLAFAETLMLRTFLKFTSYSTSRLVEKVGRGRTRRRDWRDE
jgi:hypothetical protein